MYNTIKKKLSRALLFILLQMSEPTSAPMIPPMHITALLVMSKGGTVFVTNVVTKLVICEKRIINKEFFAASFGVIEKK